MCSSALAAVGYCPDTAELEVEFHSGAIYSYEDVQEELYDRFLAADSLGRFYNAEIRHHFHVGKVHLGEAQLHSHAIRSFTYDRDHRELDVEFGHGEIYRYHGISETLYREFVHAPNHGRFFTRAIRGRYPCERLNV